MKSSYRLAPAVLALFLMPWALQADALQPRASSHGWYAWVEAGRACVTNHGSPLEACWDLAPGGSPGGRLSDLAETADGWIAAGHSPTGEGMEVFLVRDRGRGLERLPTLPPGEAPRGRPRLVVDRQRLLGVLWLEGASQPALEVRAAEWLDGAWGPVATVSPAGVGSQVAADVTVLEDGRWLALWTVFDGADDETLWSVYDGTSWSSPSPLHEDNEVPDVTPAVLATPDGAIAAWTWFDGRDYRLRTAFFGGESWRLEPALRGRGASRPELVRSKGAHLLRYSTVVPEEWVVVELDDRGRVLRRAIFESATREAPLIDHAGWGVTLRWPLSGDEVVAAWLPAPLEDQR